LNTGIAALLYIGGLMAIGVAAVYVYTAITGDESGANLQPLARKGNPFYPIFGPGPSDPSKFGGGNNTNSSSTGGNYTLPKINIPTSRNQEQPQQPQSQQPQGWWFGTSAPSSSAKAAYYYYMYDPMSAQEEERYEQPWALQH
jgi:hypothetical protein